VLVQIPEFFEFFNEDLEVPEDCKILQIVSDLFSKLREVMELP